MCVFYCSNNVCSRRKNCKTAQNYRTDKRIIYGVGDCVLGCQDYVPLSVKQDVDVVKIPVGV